MKASRGVGLEGVAAGALGWGVRVKLVLIAVIASLVFSFAATPWWAKWLRTRGYAQSIRDAEELGYAVPDHADKKGTPSMGGVVLVAGTVVSYAIAHAVAGSGPSASALLVLFLMIGLASVGFADDYIKIFRRRSTGLRAKTKLIGQAAVAISFAILALQFPNTDGLTPATQYISFVRDIAWLFLPIVRLCAVGVVHGCRHVERSEHHRWSRWTCRRRGVDGVRCLRHGRSVAVQPTMCRLRAAELLRGAQPTRPGGHCCRCHGFMLRIPVVERVARSNLHG